MLDVYAIYSDINTSRSKNFDLDGKIGLSRENSCDSITYIMGYYGTTITNLIFMRGGIQKMKKKLRKMKGGGTGICTFGSYYP